MARISMIESTIKDAAKAITKYAQKDKSFAERLVFNEGVHGNITNKVMYNQLGFDLFDRQGEITKDGFDVINNIIKNNHLSREATWFDAVKKSHKYYQKTNCTDKKHYTLQDFMEENPKF